MQKKFKKHIILEKYIKPYEVLKNDGFIIEIWKDENREYNNILDHPAVVWSSLINGNVISKCWHKNGKIHREGDVPAVITYNFKEKESKRMWYKKGRIHRDGDNPAQIFFESRQIVEERYFKKGLAHREGDLPAIIVYNKNGQILEQHWYKEGIKGIFETVPDDYLILNNNKIEFSYK
jgi:hypothetical protein